MEIRRFFVSENDINDGIITMKGDEFLHMTKVLRYKVGYRAFICCNDGYEHDCTITELNKGYAILKVNESKLVDKKNIKLTLFAGILKNNKLDFVIQKGVELGVDKVVPFLSAYSAETKFSKERADKIAIDAAKQCGTAYLTEVSELISFDSLVDKIKDFDTVLLAYENETNYSLKNTKIVGKNIAIIVGPEGGFKVDEMRKIQSEGAKIITLGKRILRAETASIVVSTLVLDKLGELDYE